MVVLGIYMTRTWALVFSLHYWRLEVSFILRDLAFLEISAYMGGGV